jgi:hypothetical protein
MVDTNIAPYFDDYQADKNFHKMLFVPRRAVQVRELNQLQTMLQEQVKRFGNHVFKDGSMVIPGEFNYDLNFEYVTVSGVNFLDIEPFLINNTVELVDNLGRVAKVIEYKANTLTDPITFFVQYTDTNDNDTTKFESGSTLTLRTSLGVNIVTMTTVGTGQGSVFTVENGIYFIKGNFIQSNAQRLVISKYTSEPSVIVGFRLKESVVSYTDDPSLLDNASGTTNFNAIGADRLKMELELEFYPSGSTFDRENFIELAVFETGELKQQARTPDYSVLEETLARRTFDESGDYTVSAFGLTVREHLKQGDNNGLYEPPQGDSSKFVVGVEPGKAYVKGFEVENISTQYIEVEKARTTTVENNSAFTAPVGNFVVVSNANTIPNFVEHQQISFYSGTFVSPGSVPTGSVLGTARVKYVSYNNATDMLAVYLFDVRNSAGLADSTFIASANSIYAPGSPALTASLESELVESINYANVFRLPVSNVKSLLDGSVSDTSLSVLRQFQTTTDTAGTVILTAGTNEIFATPTASNSCAALGGDIQDISGIATLGGIPLGKTLTINFGAGSASLPVKISTQVIKQIASQKSKVLTSSTISRTPGQFIGNRVFLGKADAHRLISVTENSVDVTSKYRLVKNDTLESYGISYIELLPGQALPSANISINFQYFLHGTGDFFSVDSYSGINYEDIPKIRIGNRDVSLSDVLDFRPRINDAGTAYTGTGGSVSECPVPFTVIRADIEHYLPRIDKVYVTSKGTFGVAKGVPSIAPVEPTTPDNAMVLYKLDVPAYTALASSIQVQYINNRRYTMRDIGKLENRISNLEYYTTLSMLETETEAMQIIDPLTGLNRFKNGFIVDNFVDHSVGSFTLPEYKCSVSSELAELRPEFSTDYVDFQFNSNISSNVTQNGRLITLPYDQVTYLTQLQASGTLNVNPYAVYLWGGQVTLTPASDVWFDTVYTEPEVTFRVFNNGNLTQSWNSWSNNWLGSIEPQNDISLREERIGGFVDMSPIVTTTTTTNTSVVGDRVVNRAVIPFMRSIEVRFKGEGLLPKSRVYAIFDNVNVSAFCKQDGKSYGQAMFTDADGEISGTFLIPNNQSARFRTGTKQFTLIDNPAGNKTTSVSYGDADFTASGTLVSRTQSIVTTQNIVQTVQPRIRFVDPLAQSFLVDKNGGLFVTSIDVFFASKDQSVPVTLEIREMVNGYPGRTVVPNGRVLLKPSQVNVSSNATLNTRFTFANPVYLMEGQEYCFVLLSNCNNYNVFIGTMGEKVVNSNAYITKQPYVGVLFKSQNNSTWTADQNSDMKFVINIAKFQTGVAGIAKFENGYPQAITLGNNPITSVSGSNTLTVNFKNHGLITGALVSVSGIGTAPGIPVGELNTQKEVTVIDNDNFTIQTTTNANTYGTFGGNTVVCTKSVIINTMQPVAEHLVFEGTDVNWTYQGITGKSLDGIETPYLQTDAFSVPVNRNTDLPFPLMIANQIDEQAKITGKSGTITANMITYNENISPVIDLDRIGLITVHNRINSPVTVSELNSTGGNAEARYITNVVGLSESANSLKVFLDVNKPQNADIKVFYRVGNSTEEVNIKSWNELTTIRALTTVDLTTFVEAEYGVDNLPNFGFYQFKIVLLSESSSVIPRVKRLRGLALGT